jgi:hypothetical protein
MNVPSDSSSADASRRIRGSIGRLCARLRSLFHRLRSLGSSRRSPDLIDRLWARLRSLFIPSVSVAAVLSAVKAENAKEAVEQLYSWERDRLLTLAKGTAAAAVTVLTSLIASAVEGKVNADPVLIYLAAILVALLLVWGAFILTGLRRLAEEYALALEIVGL